MSLSCKMSFELFAPSSKTTYHPKPGPKVYYYHVIGLCIPFYCLSVNVIVKDAEVTDSLRNFQDTITTLSQISKLAVHFTVLVLLNINCLYCSSFSLKLLPATAAPPRGSTMLTVGSQLEVYMQLEGMVDVDKEIDRLQELERKKTTQMEKLVKITKVEGYDDKVECNKGWSL